MKIAIISDIHSNLAALEAVERDARAAGVSEFHCLGDFVGYGPQPRAVTERVMQLCAVTLKGNHEHGVLDAEYARRFNYIGRSALVWTRQRLAGRIWRRSLVGFLESLKP
ncbi:MAG: metallophosphoesterase, partial [Bdellovibrionales bacterium]|nr:metallophosphoesterase [Bdellovibrionales bacterium]